MTKTALVTDTREARAPGQGCDPAARKRLWDESVKLAKLG